MELLPDSKSNLQKGETLFAVMQKINCYIKQLFIGFFPANHDRVADGQSSALQRQKSVKVLYESTFAAAGMPDYP